MAVIAIGVGKLNFRHIKENAASGIFWSGELFRIDCVHLAGILAYASIWGVILTVESPLF